jgi:hypothetical protein
MFMGVNYNDYIKTEAWQQRAEAAKVRAGHRCQICNRAASRVTLTVYHRTFERLGHEQPEDLTVLCRGCYELYERNRRIPGPPAAQPPSPAPSTDKPSNPRRPPLAPAPPSPLFAPARASKRRATLNGQNGHHGEAGELLLLLPTETIYLLASDAQSAEDANLFALAPNASDSPAAAVYQLAVEQDKQTVTQPPPAPVPARSRPWGFVVMSGLVLLLFFGLAVFAPDLPGLFSQRALVNPVAAPPVDTAPATVATIAVPVATATAAPTVAPTMTPMPPTDTPTPLPPTPTPLPPTVAPTPTEILPTVAPVPLSSVIRTALVCQNPCSCAPIVRTIPQGTEVTVLQTQTCGGDLWYQIGEEEWLGPGLVDVK